MPRRMHRPCAVRRSDKPFCDPDEKACAERPAAYRSAGTTVTQRASILLVYDEPGRRVVRGLTFDPTATTGSRRASVRRKTLQQSHRIRRDVRAQGGDFVVVYRATTTYDRSERIRDGNAVLRTQPLELALW